MKIWLSALRVRQWNKQALIVLPLIALGNEIRILDILNLFLVSFAFSLIASSIYIFNDLQDLEVDSLDPIKSQRPLASGEIYPGTARIVSVISLLSGYTIFYWTIENSNRSKVILLISLYFVVNLMYSKFKLKNFKIVGLTIVSLGFAIRFSIGTLVLDLEFSTWAFVLILQLAMFMLSGKRFQTILRSTTLQDKESQLQFWLLSMVIFAAFFAATYSGFITDSEVVAVWGKEALIISTIPLGIGLVRFVELVIHSKKYLEEDATESMTRDIFLLILVLVFTLILFLGRLNV